MGNRIEKPRSLDLAAIAIVIAAILTWLLSGSESSPILPQQDRLAEQPTGVPMLRGNDVRSRDSDIPKSPRAEPVTDSGNLARLMVATDGEPLHGAALQLLRVAQGSGAGRVAGPLLTNEEGMAYVPLDPGAIDVGAIYVEVVFTEEAVYRRTLVPLDGTAVRAGRIQPVNLPRGGLLQFDFSDLPDRARPLGLTINMFPATPAHGVLFDDPVSEEPALGTLGLQGRLGAPFLSLDVLGNGRTEPVEFPVTFVVALAPLDMPETGWVFRSYRYTGRVQGERWELPRVSVRAGKRERLTFYGSRLPKIELSVVDAGTKHAMESVKVTLAVYPLNSTWARYAAETRTDAHGIGSLRVPLGSRLPGWHIDDAQLVLFAPFPGYRTAIVRRSFQWSTQSLSIKLERDSGEHMVIMGRLLLPDGKPAAGAKLLVSPGRMQFQAQSVTSDETGNYRLVLGEDKSPLFSDSGTYLVRMAEQYSTDQDGMRRIFGLPRDKAERLFSIIRPVGGAVPELVMTRLK